MSTDACTLYCRCGVAITRELRRVPRARPAADRRPLVGPGETFEVDADFDLLAQAKAGDFLVNKDDLVGCRDGGVRDGCCGVDGMNGPNVFCARGHDVATELSDCWMPCVVVVHRARVRTSRPHWL